MIALTATDLEVELQTSMPADCSEEYELTLPARKLLDICKALPPNAEILIDVDSDRAILKSGRGRYSLGMLAASEYPVIESIDTQSQFSVTEKQLKKLIDKSEENNQDAGITGVLLATETHFLQVLEGGFDEINALFMQIVRDTRHDQVQLIAFDCVESRLFGGWTMHAIGIFEFNRDLLDDLIEQYGEEDGSVRFPVEEWKVLALISDLRQG